MVQQENTPDVGASDIGEFSPTHGFFSTQTSPRESSEKASLLVWAWGRGTGALKGVKSLEDHSPLSAWLKRDKVQGEMNVSLASF